MDAQVDAEHVSHREWRELGAFLSGVDPKHAQAIHQKVTLGDPTQVIVELAKQGRYDLIVMGTHGRTGLNHFLVGSVAERVIRLAPCPVLTVHAMM